jgi:hypothetical protein
MADKALHDDRMHAKLPCNEYYLFNCGACGGNEFACPGCECQHQYVANKDPAFALCQLDANPGCGQCCMPSFEGKIVCDALRRCTCPDPWRKFPFSNNMKGWNKQICDQCYHPDCECVHRIRPDHPDLEVRSPQCVSPLRAPFNKKLIEYRGDTSSSGHVQQMTYRAIFKGNSPCARACPARSYPPVPVSAPSIRCPVKRDPSVSYCPQRFANQNRTVQYISGHIGMPSAINDGFDPMKCCTGLEPRE